MYLAHATPKPQRSRAPCRTPGLVRMAPEALRAERTTPSFRGCRSGLGTWPPRCPLRLTCAAARRVVGHHCSAPARGLRSAGPRLLVPSGMGDTRDYCAGTPVSTVLVARVTTAPVPHGRRPRTSPAGACRSSGATWRAPARRPAFPITVARRSCPRVDWPPPRRLRGGERHEGGAGDVNRGAAGDLPAAGRGRNSRVG